MNIYDSLCKVLSDRADQVDWEAFSAADWDAFGRRAIAEGVGPLVYWTSKGFNEQPATFNTSIIPPSTLDLLAQEYYQTAARNAVLFKELDRILAALDEAGIPVIVLKGAALARTLYPDPALRPMNDLDLLVKGDDLLAAIKTLETLGYHKQMVNWHLLMRGGPEGQVPVEIHWQLLRDDPGNEFLSLEWFWQHTTAYSETQSARTLSPDAQLTYLAAHMLDKHAGGRLVWLYDIHLLVSRNYGKLALDQLSQDLSKSAWQFLLARTLILSQEQLETNLPYPVVETLKDHKNNREKFTSSLPKTLEGTRTIHVWRAMNKLSWGTRIHLARDLFFPGAGYMSWRYKPKYRWALPFYYPYRWMEIWWNGGSNLQDRTPNRI